MTFIPYMRGATAHEAQFGRICIRWPFWRFIRVGCWPRIYIDRTEDQP